MTLSISSSKQPIVVVIGGGPAGLSAAAELLSHGARVILIEAQRNLGGRAASFLHPESGEVLDLGPHTIIESNRQTLSHLARVGTRQLIEFAPSLSIQFVHPSRGFAKFHCPKLPAPYGFLWGILTFKFLSLPDRWLVIRLGRSLAAGVEGIPDISAEQWFNERGVSGQARSFFWEPLIQATLNNDSRKISLKSLAAVFEKGFLATGQSSGLGIPSVDWGKLLTGNLPDQVASHGGQVITGTRVRRIWIENGRVQGVLLAEDRRIPADAVISALPPWNLSKLLPGVPGWLAPCLSFSWSPIVSLHWVSVNPLPVTTPVAVLEGPIQWIFCKPSLSEDNKIVLSTITGGDQCQALLSGQSEGKPSVATEIAGAMQQLFPGWHPGENNWKELRSIRHATITIGPGQSHLRPGPDTDMPRLWIAGDWTNTSLPPTLESAIVSGVMAARRVVHTLKLQ